MRILIGLLTCATLACAQESWGFKALESRAREAVRVVVPHALLAGISGPSAAALRGATEVRVHAFEFDAGAAPTDAEVQQVRTRFAGSDWTRIVDVRSNGPDEIVEVYAGPQGLAVIAIEPRELAIVEIHGKVEPGQVQGLGQWLGLPEFAGRGAAPPQKIKVAPIPDAKLNFGELVRDVERQFGVRKLGLPGWLIKPAGFIGSGGRVRSFDLAVFEDTPHSVNSGFTEFIARSVPPGWMPFVEARERGESTRIWIGGANGEHMKLLIATVDGSDAVLLTTRVDVREILKDPLDWAN